MQNRVISFSIPCVIIACSMAFYLHTIVSYDSRQAVEYITSHSEKKSKGKCANYVRRALIAGGIPAYLKTSACNYSKILPLYGFKEIGRPETYRKGDIVTFPSVDNHPHGHIAMWNGEQWVSDFKQKSIIVNNAYKKADYKIWRHRFE